MKEKESKELLLSVFGVVIIIIAVVGVTYAIFRYTSFSEKNNEISTGAISMSYIESDTNVIKINNAVPMLDEVGKKQNDYFDFNISTKVTGKLSVSYEIWAKQVMVENSLDPNQIKFYLEKKQGALYEQVLEPIIFNPSDTKGMRLYTLTHEKNSNDIKEFVDNYRFRMWIDKNADFGNVAKTFKVKIDVYAKA